VSYLALAVLAGLAAVERKGFLQAMLSRPIALGPIAGLALGDAAGGLLVGAPLELLWLGAVNLGAALPVHEALGTCAVAGAAVLAGHAMGTGATPAIATLAVLLCAPLALAGRHADRYVESRFNERLVARADRLCACGRVAAAGRTNLLGLALPFALAAVLAPLGAALGRFVIPQVLRALPALDHPLALGWVAFSAFACASGAKALRAKAAPAFFFSAFAAAAVAGAALLWLRPEVRP
jgi:mannose/fructose/N-acetylgalactosamine-specific phosphotransferase system component IIC